MTWNVWRNHLHFIMKASLLGIIWQRCWLDFSDCRKYRTIKVEISIYFSRVSGRPLRVNLIEDLYSGKKGWRWIVFRHAHVFFRSLLRFHQNLPILDNIRQIPVGSIHIRNMVVISSPWKVLWVTLSSHWNVYFLKMIYFNS